MFKFDLSAIPHPEQVAVAQATLRVYVQSRTNASTLMASACAVNRPWVAEEATWLQADASTAWAEPGCNGEEDRSQTCSPEAEFSKADGWVSIDVTDIVQGWLNGSLENEGLILKTLSGGSVGYKLVSVDDQNVSLRPVLRIVFVVIPTPTPTPTPIPEISLTKEGPEGPLFSGEAAVPFTYTLTVENPGGQAVSGVVVTDVLPLGVDFVSATDGGALEGGMVTWEIGSLAPGESKAVGLQVVLSSWVKEGTLVNLAQASCAECPDVQEAHWEIPVVVQPPRVYRLHLVTVYNGFVQE